MPPGKIAVIYKENKYGEELLPYFKLKNLPVYSKRSINLLEDPLIGQMLLIIRYLASEHEIPFSGDEMLFEILHAEWFRIPAIEIASIAAEVAQKQYSSEKISLRNCLAIKPINPVRDLFSQPLNPRWQRLRNPGNADQCGLEHNIAILIRNYFPRVGTAAVRHAASGETTDPANTYCIF